MTGGHNNTVGSVTAEGGFNDNAKSYTTGGQIGAPSNRGCTNSPPKGSCVNNVCSGGPNAGNPCDANNDCPSSTGRDSLFPWGDWQHTHHNGPDDFNDISGGSFSFHSGTAAAPPEAFIKNIICGDPGWCQQARPAPVKQIFWEGTGVFRNEKGTKSQNLPLPIFANCVDQPVVWSNKGHGTLHYYRAHVGDFGEPAGSKQNPPTNCPWADASGVSISNCALTNPVDVLPATPNGGGTTTCVAETCAECPDWYEIEIHCTADPNSPIAYKVANFITDGNFQLHPPVGDNCNSGPVTKFDEQPLRGETWRESFVARVVSFLPALDVR